MRKPDLINILAEELWVSTNTSRDLLNALLKAMMKGVKKKWKLKFQNFWTFKRVHIKGRTDYFPRNPNEKITLKDTITVNFKAWPKFKKLIK